MKKNVGMWIFLSSELLIFGTFIILFEVFNYRHYDDFKLASKDLHLMLGTLNTFVLLTSSWFVARAQELRKKSNLLFAIALGFLFIMTKSYEYLTLTEEGKFPLNFKNISESYQFFFMFYGYMTFIHAIHLIIGIICLFYVYFTWNKDEESERVEENIGLYWHFVDVVWVFLYAIFYLPGNS